MTEKNTMPVLKYRDYKRFWSKVNVSLTENGCWEWQRGTNIGGYGIFDLTSKSFVAHRVSYFMFNKVDPEQLCCCHICDNRLCVRPSHIFLGTDKDNVHDMHLKGRFSKRAGEDNNKSILKEWQVIEIKKVYAEEGRQKANDLGLSYGVKNISPIIFNKTWKGVGGVCDNSIVYIGKLSSVKVLEIREKLKNGHKAKDLAIFYNVTKETIYNIQNGNSWKSVINE